MCIMHLFKVSSQNEMFHSPNVFRSINHFLFISLFFVLFRFISYFKDDRTPNLLVFNCVKIYWWNTSKFWVWIFSYKLYSYTMNEITVNQIVVSWVTREFELRWVDSTKRFVVRYKIHSNIEEWPWRDLWVIIMCFIYRFIFSKAS